MKKILLLASVTLILGGCLGMPYIGVEMTVPAGSVTLGERFVPFRGDHDVIEIGPYDGRFRSLYFVVQDNDIEITSFVVTYSNGERERFDTRLVFDRGTRSRTVMLRGGERRIRNIDFTYRTIGDWRDGRAHVQVYGER
jgi:hypothetical protein